MVFSGKDASALLADCLAGTIFIDYEVPQVQFSARFYEVLGYDPAATQFSFANLKELIPDDDAQANVEAVTAWRHSQGQPLLLVPMRHRHAQGHYINLLVMVMARHRNEQGVITRAAGTYINLEKLAGQQNILADRNQLLQIILEDIRAGIFDWNLITDLVHWSNNFFDLLQMPRQPQPMMASQLMQLVHPEDLPRMQHQIEQHFAHGTPYNLQIRMLCGNGQYRWFNASGAVARLGNGQPYRMCGSAIDINDVVHAQEDLQAARFMLAEACALSGLGHWEIDLLTGKSYLSPEVYAVYEQEPQSERFFSEGRKFVEPQDQLRLDQAIARVKEQHIPWDLELQMTSLTGARKWTRSVGKPLFNNKGEVVGVAGVFQDITEQKRRELDLQNSLALISEQNKRLQNFAHIVGHNLRHHTDNLQMLARLLRAASPEERDQMADMILATTHRLNETLQHLNEVVQMQSGIDMKTQEVQLSQLVRDVKAVLHGQIELHHAQISYSFEAAPSLHSVPAYLESIVQNLVSNSIKYRHPQRTPVVHISSFKLEGGRVAIKIADNGLGIDLKRHGQKLFGMYKVFHKNEDARGLGLFITKNQVEALNGQIDVESTPGQGTTFTIVL